MATGLLETGPKLDWTRDNKIFDLLPDLERKEKSRINFLISS